MGEGLEGKSVGKYGLGKRNAAGDRFVEFAETNEMCITNTMFQQPKRRLYTWTSPKNHRNQIDYILIKNRWTSTILSTKTYPGAESYSDHELLVSKFKIKLKSKNRSRLPKRYDLSNLNEYTIEINNRFACLREIPLDPEGMWNIMSETIKTTANQNIQAKKKKSKSPWLSQKAIDIAEKRRMQKINGGSRDEINKLNALFQRQARKDKDIHINKICRELEEDNKRGRIRDVFKKRRNYPIVILQFV